jgi:hypothetical protein
LLADTHNHDCALAEDQEEDEDEDEMEGEAERAFLLYTTGWHGNLIVIYHTA